MSELLKKAKISNFMIKITNCFAISAWINSIIRLDYFHLTRWVRLWNKITLRERTIFTTIGYHIRFNATALLNRAPCIWKVTFLGGFLNRTPLFLFQKSTFWGISWIEPHPKTHFKNRILALHWRGYGKLKARHLIYKLSFFLNFFEFCRPLFSCSAESTRGLQNF